MRHEALVIPPAPRRPPAPLGTLRAVAVMQRNALELWTEDAYAAELVERRFLGRASVLLNAPSAIRHVLVDQPGRYGRTPATERILRPILGDGLFLAEGDAWRRQRRTLSPAFVPRAIALLTWHMAEVAGRAIAGLAAERSGLDLLGFLQALTLEIAGRSMFSLETRRHGPALRALVDRYGAGLGRPALMDFLLPRWIATPRDLLRHRIRRRWMALLEQMMAERRAAGREDQPRDLFDLLSAARDPETGAALDPEELRDQVATLILAGHETTALALFWSAYLLALAPAVQDAVAAEAAPLGLSPASAAGELDRLPLTRAVVQEAMRLYPPAFTIVREAREEDRIGDLEIRSGTIVVISPWILHRHRQYWHAPEAFDPGRFLAPAGPVDRFVYLPFGAGPRVCIGAQFALAEATLVLAMLARAFRITLEDHRPVLPVAVVTTRPDHSPPFRMSPR